MGLTRGSLTLPRMNAHRLVIIAAALTVAVAAALATALVTFGGQALPRAVRHDLARAAGTSLVMGGNVDASQGAQYTSLLRGKISAALDGTPFTFYRAYWSDPLGFVPGSRPVPPGGTGTTQIAVAATLETVAGHAVLVSGHWPGAQAGGPIPAALPSAAAALMHVPGRRRAAAARPDIGSPGPVRGDRRVPAPAGVGYLLGAGRRRAGRLEHPVRLHHVRPAGRARPGRSPDR